MIEYIWRVKGSDIFYTPQTNGGGDHFFPEYLDLVIKYYGRVHHIMEWCSGPGFIGYGMVACNICDRLSLLDKFEPAIEMAKKTANNSRTKDIDLVDPEKIHHRRLFPRVKIYHSDNCSVLPEDEKIDLVVGNPPHFENEEDAIKALSAMGSPVFNDHLSEILLDSNWDAHRDMFNQLSTRLSDGGRICLQLHSGGSNVDTFKPMVEEAGLRITATMESGQYPDIYYMEVQK